MLSTPCVQVNHTIFPLLKNGANTCELGCVLHPSTLRSRCRVRNMSRIRNKHVETLVWCMALCCALQNYTVWDAVLKGDNNHSAAYKCVPGISTPVRCGRAGTVSCASNDGTNCFWGLCADGGGINEANLAYSVTRRNWKTGGSRPHHTTCPGWEATNGRRVCHSLKCPPLPAKVVIKCTALHRGTAVSIAASSGWGQPHRPTMSVPFLTRDINSSNSNHSNKPTCEVVEGTVWAMCGKTKFRHWGHDGTGLARATGDCTWAVSTNMVSGREQWCNADKAVVMSSMARPGYSDPGECIAMCSNNAACEWVGFQRSDRYCEFWGAGSCQIPHDQSGHDVYKVGTGSSGWGALCPVIATAGAATNTNTPCLSENLLLGLDPDVDSNTQYVLCLFIRLLFEFCCGAYRYSCQRVDGARAHTHTHTHTRAHGHTRTHIHTRARTHTVVRLRKHGTACCTHRLHVRSYTRLHAQRHAQNIPEVA